MVPASVLLYPTVIDPGVPVRLVVRNKPTASPAAPVKKDPNDVVFAFGVNDAGVVDPVSTDPTTRDPVVVVVIDVAHRFVNDAATVAPVWDAVTAAPE